jgi:Fe-S oxidoreductase/nitrate reductase gamma subunit
MSGLLNIRPILATGELTREVFHNQPPAAKAIFYILSMGSLLLFAWGVYRRMRLWRLGRPTQEKRSLRAVLASLLHNGLLQRRVLGRGRASLAHVLLFSGFMVLLLATTLLSIEHGLAVLLGRPAGEPVFHKGVYFAIYELVSDAFGLVLLAGCVLFIIRRLKPPASLGHNWTDWAILATLVILDISGYMLEGLRILDEQTRYPGFSFVGLLAARLFELFLSRASAAELHFLLWWFHAVLALALVAAFPYTRLLHSLAGAVRLASGPAPLGVMVKLSEEEVEQTGVIGVGEVRQFGRRQLVELDACVSCGRCEEACPAFEAGKPLSPRKVVQDIRRHLNAVGPGLLSSARSALATSGSEAAPGLHGATVAAETLWSCTTCSACVDVCPLGVNPLGFITDMRRHVVGAAQLRGSPAVALQKTERSGNPWGLRAEDRMAWAAGLDVPTPQTRPDFELLYWVGCAAAYDRRSQKVARAVIQLLSAAKVAFAVLSSQERCTGEWARRMGDEFLFQQLATANVQTLAQHGVRRGSRKIVSHCPHCVNSFKNDYPQMGGDYEVVHHTVLLAQLVREGRLPIDRSLVTEPIGKMTYHDPCYLARVGGVTEPPRQLLQLMLPDGGARPTDAKAAPTLAGPDTPVRQLIELPRHGRQTACCGAGGGRMWFEDAPAQRIGIGRVKEMLATGADTVAVSCPFCLIMVSEGTAAQGGNVQVRDIAELLLEKLTPEPQSPSE